MKNIGRNLRTSVEFGVARFDCDSPRIRVRCSPGFGASSLILCAKGAPHLDHGQISIPRLFLASASFASKNSVPPATKHVHEIQEVDRIAQRIGRIGKAATSLTSLPLDRWEEGFEHAKRDCRFSTLAGFWGDERRYRCPDERSADHDHADRRAKRHCGLRQTIYGFRSCAVALRSN